MHTSAVFLGLLRPLIPLLLVHMIKRFTIFFVRLKCIYMQSNCTMTWKEERGEGAGKRHKNILLRTFSFMVHHKKKNRNNFHFCLQRFFSVSLHDPNFTPSYNININNHRNADETNMEMDRWISCLKHTRAFVCVCEWRCGRWCVRAAFGCTIFYDCNLNRAQTERASTNKRMQNHFEAKGTMRFGAHNKVMAAVKTGKPAGCNDASHTASQNGSERNYGAHTITLWFLALSSPPTRSTHIVMEAVWAPRTVRLLAFFARP